MTEERNELENCPMCKVGKMTPYGSTTTLMKNKDGETNKVISDLRGYKCDKCGYPEGGQTTVANTNEEVSVKD